MLYNSILPIAIPYIISQTDNNSDILNFILGLQSRDTFNYYIHACLYSCLYFLKLKGIPLFSSACIKVLSIGISTVVSQTTTLTIDHIQSNIKVGFEAHQHKKDPENQQ